MNNIQKIVYAYDHSLPVKIEFTNGEIGPHETVDRFGAEEFTLVLSPELARQEGVEPGSKRSGWWECLKKVELLTN